MTERNYGITHNTWTGKVVSVNDPDKSGRVQVRIFSLHDNTVTVPDNALLWALPAPDVTSASWNKIGGTPVGIIVGAIIEGYWMDSDMQIPVFTHSAVKAGDPDTSSNTTSNGQVQLIPGTNSSPLGGRIANNAFVTRKGKNIVEDDKTGSKGPTQQKDSDGQDITKDAKANTKFATNPTTASIENPSGSILQQILNVDPKNLNAVLPNAVSAIQKIKDLANVSTTGGINNLLGSVLGQAMNQLGASQTINAIGSALSQGGLSSSASQALYVAIQSLGSTSNLSSGTQAIVGTVTPAFTAALNSLIQNNQLNSTTFNALINQFFSTLQNAGSQATLGTNLNTILNNLESVLPTLASSVNSILKGHLPESVLNSSAITEALQRFAMSQAFLKLPDDGKKALAILATTGAQGQLSSALGSIAGLTQTTITNITKLF